MLKSKTITPISDDAFHVVAAYLERFFPLSTAFKAQLRSVLSEVAYPAGSYILNTGAKQPIAWFLLDGLLQEIAVDQETYAAKTAWFWCGVSFVYTTPGYFDREPSQVSIGVVKPSRVAFISYDNWKVLRETFDEAEKLSELIRSEFEQARKTHLTNLSLLDTSARYLKYEVKINQLFHHIKLKHIAEYLGMSTDTLGKLRRKFIKSRGV